MNTTDSIFDIYSFGFDSKNSSWVLSGKENDDIIEVPIMNSSGEHAVEITTKAYMDLEKNEIYKQSLEIFLDCEDFDKENIKLSFYMPNQGHCSPICHYKRLEDDWWLLEGYFYCKEANKTRKLDLLFTKKPKKEIKKAYIRKPSLLKCAEINKFIDEIFIDITFDQIERLWYFNVSGTIISEWNNEYKFGIEMYLDETFLSKTFSIKNRDNKTSEFSFMTPVPWEFVKENSNVITIMAMETEQCLYKKKIDIMQICSDNQTQLYLKGLKEVESNNWQSATAYIRNFSDYLLMANGKRKCILNQENRFDRLDDCKSNNMSIKKINIQSTSTSELELLYDNDIKLDLALLSLHDGIIYSNYLGSQVVEENYQYRSSFSYNSTSYKYWPPIDVLSLFTGVAIDAGAVYCYCPFSGTLLKAIRSFYIPVLSNVMAYLFISNNRKFFLLTGTWLSEKFALFFPEEGLFLLTSSFSSRQFDDNQLELIAKYLKSIKYDENQQSDDMYLIIGTLGNLGHYFWQQLSGLNSLIENNKIGKIKKILLGPYDKLSSKELFPEISEKTIEFDSIEEIAKFTKDNCGQYICFSERIIPKELRERIVTYSIAKTNGDNYVEILKLKKNHFILWINIRSHNKYWCDQVHGFAYIINKLHMYVDLCVVFDGTLDSDETINQITSLLYSSIKVIKANAFPLHKTIAVAALADFYITVVGSGLVLNSWINKTPGIAYANTPHLNQKEFWFKVAEDVIMPQFLPHEYVKEFDNTMYGNYEINCVDFWKYIKKMIKKSVSKERMSSVSKNNEFWKAGIE